MESVGESVSVFALESETSQVTPEFARAFAAALVLGLQWVSAVLAKKPALVYALELDLESRAKWVEGSFECEASGSSTTVGWSLLTAEGRGWLHCGCERACA